MLLKYMPDDCFEDTRSAYIGRPAVCHIAVKLRAAYVIDVISCALLQCAS